MQQIAEAVDVTTNGLTDSSYAGSVPTWIRDARKTIRQSDTNFFKVSPIRYWADFLLSLIHEFFLQPLAFLHMFLVQKYLVYLIHLFYKLNAEH